ncbi:MAG TPA: hypothetical protein VMV92_33620 [Streptosporangiaceae bacterium]|nr:hypothetical protein [Streptosporangiaceae bacterium]
MQLSKAWKEAAIGTLESHLGTAPGGMIWFADESWAHSARISASKAAAGT